MDIAKLTEKLEELIDLNPDGDYSYINDEIPEEKIAEFEAKHGIRLPEDYRTFLNQMFDGGIGPKQIMPLEWWDSRHNTVYIEGLGNKLSEPFLLTDSWKKNYDKKEDNNYTSVLNGTIRICHIGCGNFIFLVVNGAEYGNLWIDDRASTGEIIPLTDKEGERVTFSKWYFSWLDEEIEYYKNKPNEEEGEDEIEDFEATEPQQEPEQVPASVNTDHKSTGSFWNRIKGWFLVQD
jgi:SMI1 / KNR4 family (SUKH-1)